MKTFILTSVLAALALNAPAQAETVNCTAITTLPYTITTQGVYCLTGPLNTGITAGSAITIDASNVVLDLNGFKLGGLAAGKGTMAIGISASQRQNITIRNGIVRGFWAGISLDGTFPYTASQGHLVENIRADQNTYIGIYVAGTSNVVRNNQVVATGGSTIWGANAHAHGISIAGPGAQILDNIISDVAAQGTGSANGIVLNNNASNCMVEGNRIGKINATGTGRYGVRLLSGSDILVSGNILTSMEYGIFLGAATGKYRSNITQGVTTPYTGGTAAGATNF